MLSALLILQDAAVAVEALELELSFCRNVAVGTVIRADKHRMFLRQRPERMLRLKGRGPEQNQPQHQTASND